MTSRATTKADNANSDFLHITRMVVGDKKQNESLIHSDFEVVAFQFYKCPLHICNEGENDSLKEDWRDQVHHLQELFFLYLSDLLLEQKKLKPQCKDA